MYECNVVVLLVGWIVGWFVSDLGKKMYLTNINGRYFIIQYILQQVIALVQY